MLYFVPAIFCIWSAECCVTYPSFWKLILLVVNLIRKSHLLMHLGFGNLNLDKLMNIQLYTILGTSEPIYRCNLDANCFTGQQFRVDM
jgi:hypothetical protein